MKTNALINVMKQSLIISCWLAALTTVVQVDAATFDAVQDFSLSSNPTGAWSYGTLSSFTGGTFTLFTVAVADGNYTGQEVWYNGGTIPNAAAVGNNTTGSPQSYYTIVDPPDQLHLDGENFIADVRWISPARAKYNITGLFQRTDTTAKPVSVRIIQNQSTVLFSVDNFATYGNQELFSIPNISLPAGTVLDFAEGAGQYDYDSTGLKVTITTVAHDLDFNGDGKPDFLLFNASTLQTAIWHIDDGQVLNKKTGPTLPTGWTLVGRGDFDGDDKPDYVLYQPSTRGTAIWSMNDNQYLGNTDLKPLPAGWTIAAVADFNGDGHPDFLLFNAATLETRIWYFDGVQFLKSKSGPTLPAGWTLAGTADFHEDGNQDFLLFNPTTRHTAIWTMDNNVFVTSVKGKTLPANCTLLGAADYNLDGHPDYLIFNTSTLRTTISHLNVNQFVDSVRGPVLPAGFTVIAR